jgi:hypothetical protein
MIKCATSRGLPAISELVHSLLAWPGMQIRWRGDFGHHGDDFAVPVTAKCSWRVPDYLSVRNGAAGRPASLNSFAAAKLDQVYRTAVGCCTRDVETTTTPLTR